MFRSRSNFFVAAVIGTSPLAACGAASPFYMGGDVSLLPFIESRGGSFRDGGQVRPAEQIMVNHGANLFRLRLFVNPNTSYEATNGAIQDLSYTIALAQRLKQTGANILLDFHYSDTWADPGHQAKPAAWAGHNWATLNSTVRDYTKNTLMAFRDAGVMPEMVQVGNEITNGMLYGTSVVPPNGGHIVYSGPNQNASWQNLGSLLNNAIAGVRDVDALDPGRHTEIAIHCDGGDVQGRAQYYFNQLANVAGVSPGSYDVMGMSFYPNSSTDFPNLQTNLNYLANNFTKKVMVLEANYRWKGSATGAPWPSSQTGQRDYLIAVRDLVKNLPNNRGAGVVWWYPESIQVPGTFIWQGGAVALFDDSGGDALPALSEFSTSPATWNVDADGDWYDAMNWTGGVPMFAGNAANFGQVITAPRTVNLNGPRTVAIVNFDNANSYTIAGSGLTFDAVSGSAAISVTGGSHTISAPVTLNDDMEVQVSAPGGALTISGAFGATNRSITKTGAGVARFANVRAAALHVDDGTVAILANGTDAGASRVATLNLAPGGALDLNDNDLVVTNDTVAAVASSIAAARNGGAWDQPGITSSAARDHPQGATGLAAVSGADYISVNSTSFDGFVVAASDVLVKYTYYGDTDLNGLVDFDDYVRADAGFNSGLGGWFNGDIDLSGAVDFDDYVLIDLGFNAQSGTLRRAQAFLSGEDSSLADMTDPSLRIVADHFTRFGSSYARQFLTAIPEPVSPIISGVVASATALLRPRRPRCRKFE